MPKLHFHLTGIFACLMGTASAWAWVYRSDTAAETLLATLGIAISGLLVVFCAARLHATYRLDELRAARHARADAAWQQHKSARKVQDP